MTDLKPIELEAAFVNTAREGPQFFSGRGCAYFNNWSKRNRRATAWLTFVIEWDEESGEFLVDLDCDSPHPDHWVSYVIDNGGVADLVCDFGAWRPDLPPNQVQMDWMMRRGVAPGQRFLAEVVFSVWTDYQGEHDEEVDLDIMRVEPWTDEQVLSAWEEILTGDDYAVRHR